MRLSYSGEQLAHPVSPTLSCRQKSELGVYSPFLSIRIVRFPPWTHFSASEASSFNPFFVW